MSVTQYQCTICRRIRDVVDTNTSITITTRCTITQGCRGVLLSINKLPFTNRETSPPIMEGVTDWQQRNILWTHEQRIATTKWRIVHTLNVPFVVDVMVRDSESNLVSLSHDQFQVDVTEQNLVSVSFDSPQRGIVQLIARNGSKQRVYESVDESEMVRVSQNGKLTIFDASSRLDSGTATIGVQVITPDGTTYDGEQTITTEGLERTTWNVAGVIYNGIIQMKAFTLSLSNIFIVPVIGVIPDGSRLRFVEIFGRNIKRHEIVLGLVHDYSKFDVFNCDKDRTIDVSRLLGGIIVRSGEAYVEASDVEATVPPLRVIGAQR